MKLKAFTKKRTTVTQGRTSRPPATSPASAADSRIALKNILVPIDFSDCSRKALRYAIPFAKQFNARLTLVYVVKPLGAASEYGWADLPLVESQMVESGRDELTKWVKQEVQDDVSLQTLVRVGTPHREIVETAKSLETDLIIVSTHGRTGLKHVLLGSTTESVVRHAKCPVLVVREHEHEFVAD